MFMLYVSSFSLIQKPYGTSRNLYRYGNIDIIRRRDMRLSLLLLLLLETVYSISTFVERFLDDSMSGLCSRTSSFFLVFSLNVHVVMLFFADNV